MFKRNLLITLMIVILFIVFIMEGCSRKYVQKRKDITGNLVITNSSSQGIKSVEMLSKQDNVESKDGILSVV